MRIHIFHTWDKWKIESDRYVRYSTPLGASGILREIIQSKQCLDCGKVKYKTTDIG